MKGLNTSISFHFLNVAAPLHNRKQLKRFINELFIFEKVPLKKLCYIFCSDDYLYNFNQVYLKHDSYTDIITFPLSEKDFPVIADIYISVDRIKENSQTLHTVFDKELHRVVFHGALHLCGYLDKTTSKKRQMRLKEDFYLTQYFVSREML